MRGLSRRAWLSAIWPQIYAAQQHARRAATANEPAKLEVLDSQSARQIEAIAARILPAGDTPGAREAGVLYFIDRALATFDKDQRRAYRQGLRQIEAQRRKLFPGSPSFAALSEEQQDQLLRAIENTPFFNLVRRHTVLGFFGDPRWGGNRDHLGWKLIGFEDKFHFEPPFGYYDG
jgi:gluconate 2-dehydrogenase gamma chain